MTVFFSGSVIPSWTVMFRILILSLEMLLLKELVHEWPDIFCPCYVLPCSWLCPIFVAGRLSQSRSQTFRVAHAVWNGTLKAVNSLASVQQGRMDFVWLFLKQGSILASESLLHCSKDSLLQRCDGKQYGKLCVISGVVLIALLIRLKKHHNYKSCWSSSNRYLGYF